MGEREGNPLFSLRAYKGHFTRAEAALDRVITYVRDNPSVRGVAEMEENLDKLKKCAIQVENLSTRLAEEAEDDKSSCGRYSCS